MTVRSWAQASGCCVIVSVLLAVPLVAEPPSASIARERLAGVDALADGMVRAWRAPGIALAVVADGEIVHAAGYGLRDIERQEPMTPDTLFAIGSTTKAMTATVLGMLVDDGRLAWDEPVQSYLPTFRLSDPDIGRRLTPRDLLTHRSGLPRHDLVWYGNEVDSRAGLVARLAHLELTADLRERFQYNNLMYLTAGYLVEQLTGASWEDNVRGRLFEPLGMRRSNFSVAASQRDPDHALPYVQDEETDAPRRVPFRSLDVIGPAGSVNSSVREMAQWLLFNLRGGLAGDRRLIQAATLAEIHSPQMPLGIAPDRPDVSEAIYGMGWDIQSYRGHRRLAHDGGIDGFITSVVIFPDDGVGLVAFTNTMVANLGSLLNAHAADRLLGLEPVDWNGEVLARHAAGRAAQGVAGGKRDALRRAGTHPSHPLGDYAGTFEHPGYGALVVSLAAEDRLEAHLHSLVAPLEHWHYDVWRAGGRDSGDGMAGDLFAFAGDVDGNIASVSVLLEPRAAPIVFVRRPDARLFEPDYLRRCEGSYRIAGTDRTAVVELSGGALRLALDGESYHLDPDLGGRFVAREFKVLRIGFEEGGDGRIRAATIFQPEGAYAAPRVE